MSKQYNHHSSAQGPARRGQLIVKRDRMQRMVRMMVDRPDVSQTEMAVKLGCSQPAVSNYMKVIFAEWLETDKQQAQHKFLLRLRQLEGVYGKAIDAFQRSQQNVERVTTEYVPVRCKKCAKDRVNPKCPACKGTGTTLVERTTRQVTGQAGDSSLLTAAVNALRQMAKLEGLFRSDILTNADRDGGVAASGVKLDYSKLTTEELLTVRRAFARIAITEDKTIETNSTEETE